MRGSYTFVRFTKRGTISLAHIATKFSTGIQNSSVISLRMTDGDFLLMKDRPLFDVENLPHPRRKPFKYELIPDQLINGLWWI